MILVKKDLDMLLNEKPLVAVYMITYNHEQYIKQTIKSILNQQTKFLFKLFIGEDASSDNTTTICKVFEDEYPNKIKLFAHKKNIGASANAIFTFNECFKSEAKYIALCEGDDYWTDPLKLQKQVDFLEANPEYGICFHNVKIFDQANQKLIEDTITRDVEETTDISELAKGNFIHTPSVMLCNDFRLPSWFKDSPIGDWSIYMIAIGNRKIKKLDEVMAVYRVHDASIWSGLLQKVRNEKTRISIKLVVDNLELPNKALKILKSRLGIKKKKKTFIQKIIKKLKKLSIK